MISFMNQSQSLGFLYERLFFFLSQYSENKALNYQFYYKWIYNFLSNVFELIFYLNYSKTTLANL